MLAGGVLRHACGYSSSPPPPATNNGGLRAPQKRLPRRAGEHLLKGWMIIWLAIVFSLLVQEGWPLFFSGRHSTGRRLWCGGGGANTAAGVTDAPCGRALRRGHAKRSQSPNKKTLSGQAPRSWYARFCCGRATKKKSKTNAAVCFVLCNKSRASALISTPFASSTLNTFYQPTPPTLCGINNTPCFRERAEAGRRRCIWLVLRATTNNNALGEAIGSDLQ